ncbi:hypothetical protein PMAYCL1PPCAC_24838, partial [Pristionchus mayeri]
FSSLFFGFFLEKGKKEVKLEDVAYEEFIELLHIIYPSRKKITDESYEFLLKIGDRFDIAFVIDRVEDFLIKSTTISLDKKRELAEQYRLARLGVMDFSDSSDNRSDVSLIVGGMAIHVNKQYLGMYSPVFHRLFFDNSDDREKNEFELEGVDYKDFIDLLHVIYPSKKAPEGSAEGLLKLAKRFDIGCVTEQAEASLIASRTISILEKLRISEQYKLFRLQDHCFSELTAHCHFEAVKRSSVYKILSDATKAALFEQMVKKIK